MFPLHRHNCQQSALYIKKQNRQNKHRKNVRAAQSFLTRKIIIIKKGFISSDKKKPGFHLSGESRIRWSVSDDLINHQSLSAFLFKNCSRPFSFYYFQ
jgi:hypothetical protein